MFHNYKSYLKSYSQKNRRGPTQSEGLMRNCLLKGDRLGYRFLRQKPVGNYILDFYCPKLKLCIEIDGESHNGMGQYDEDRDAFLKSLGIKTVRYKDNWVIKHLESVGLDVEGLIQERERELKIKQNPPS